MGLTIDGQRGDAVLIEAIEPARSLHEIAQEHHLAGTPVPNHRSLAIQVIDIVEKLGRAGLGHSDLHLGNFLVRDGRVFLIDAYPIHRGGMTMRDVLLLANSAQGFATRADLQRGWNTLGPGGKMPRRNPQARSVYRKLMSKIYGENRYFESLQAGAWQGVCFKQFPSPRRWSRASQRTFTRQDWEQACTQLLAQIESDQLTVLKRGNSGDVLEGQMIVAGRPIEVIVKRPRRRYWYRYLNEIGRGHRARRAWWKSWRLIYRGVACAWPLVLLERRTLGYVTDGLIVFEKIRGPSLARIDLGELAAEQRGTLFHRVGALLRRLEAVGLYHWDAKSANWMVQLDDATGPLPLLVDVDGVRNNWGTGEGLRRLRESLKLHKQFTAEDEAALLRGYQPFAGDAG
jgi:tRNA A-37 threonylcarbamoyl transferase component Bud32